MAGLNTESRQANAAWRLSLFGTFLPKSRSRLAFRLILNLHLLQIYGPGPTIPRYEEAWGLPRGPIRPMGNRASAVMSMILLAVFPIAMIFGAVWDLTTMTIPNLLTLALAAAFAVLVPFIGLTLQEIGLHVAAGVLMLLVGMALFAFGWIGGGDAKFVAATALWVGMSELLAYLILASVFGGVLTLLVLVFRSFSLPLFMQRRGWIARLHDRKEGIPYGIALALGGLMIFPQTVWFAAAAHAA